METHRAAKGDLPRVSEEVIRELEARLILASDPETAEREASAVGELIRAVNPHLYKMLNHELNRMMPYGFHMGVPLAAALTYETFRMEVLKRGLSGQA